MLGEGAYGDEVVVLRPSLHRALHPILPIEPEAKVAHNILRNITRLPDLHLLEKAREVMVVILNRFHRAAALYLDVLQELPLCLLRVHTHIVASEHCATFDRSEEHTSELQSQ